MSLVKSRSRSRLRKGGAPDAMRHCIVLTRPMHQTGRGGWKADRGSGYSFTESRKLDPLQHNNPQEEPMRKAGTTAFTATFAGLLAAIAVSAALAQEGEKQLYEA